MNTMKKEDMMLEQGNLIAQIGYDTMRILKPLAQLLGAVGRVNFLQSEIEKVTPKQKPAVVPDIENNDATKAN